MSRKTGRHSAWTDETSNLTLRSDSRLKSPVIATMSTPGLFVTISRAAWLARVGGPATPPSKPPYAHPSADQQTSCYQWDGAPLLHHR
jgi:hypothetical protein